MSNPVCSDALVNLFAQRKNRTGYSVPLVRLNLVSPYPRYTQDQLNMRRKVEILKYADKNTQTNGQTKSQKWTNIVRQSTQYTNTSTDLTTNRCPADTLKPTLTTACDVPGPPIYLAYDPNVPLYNYGNEKRSYAILNRNDTSLYKIYTKNEIAYLQSDAVSFTNNYAQSIEPALGVIIITDFISTPITTYNISTPIGLWTRGIYISLGNDPYNIPSRPNNVPNITISITKVTLNAYINNTLIQSQNVPFSLSNLKIDPNKTSPQVFYAIQYAGMLNVSNIVLKTQPGYIYDLKLLFEYSYNISAAQQIAAFEAGVFCNLSQDSQNVFSNPNCPNSGLVILSSPNTSPPYSSGTFTQYNNL